MFGILRLIFKGTREVIQEQSAKRDLEQKLGRKVSKDELYSLGSHLDAAQPNAPQQPLQSTPRESAVPFADAKPPMKTRTKLIIAGALVLVIGFIGVLIAGFVILNMPQRTFNRLNPFSPKPPEGTFPAQIGNYVLQHKPDYEGVTSYYAAPHFEAEYKEDSNSLKYALWIYNSEADLDADFEKRKGSFRPTEKSKVVDNSDTRYALAALDGWTSCVLYKDGKYLKQISAFRQQRALDFEGLLKNAAPLAAVPLNVDELKKSSPESNPSVTVLQLLDDYKKDPSAADKKYKGKKISVTGTVEVSEKDKKGNWMIGFMRPGSTAPKDGMVVCSFDKSQESRVSSVKKGDLITLQGSVFGNILFSVIMQNCSKL